MSTHSSSARPLSRRSAALFALGVALVALLLMSWHGSPASADSTAYPPSNPSSSSSFSIEPTSESRGSTAASSSDAAGTDSDSSSGLSSTGFQTLAATTIALALLGGGAIFLGLGRRRRHG